MLKTMEHWKNTLGKLGVRVQRRRMGRKSVDMGCSFETLENRIAMSIDSLIIAGLSASPISVPSGSQIIFTATGVTDPNGDAISYVEVFRDVDNDGAITVADGAPLGTDTDGSDGWILSVSTAGFPAGDIQFLARAVDETNLASDPVAATATVLAPTRVLDDGESGFSIVSGTWQGPSNGGYNNDHYFSHFNNGVVEWRFANVVPGTYRVSATWTNTSSRSASAPYEVIDGTNGLATVLVNQKNAPAADATEGGRNFQHLGEFEIVNGELVVRLTNTSATTMSADAVRLEHIGPAVSASEIRVYDGSAELFDAASTINLGSTFIGTEVPRTLTVKNVGVGTLNLTQLTQGVMPAGIKLVSGYGSTTLAQGETTTFTVALAAVELGSAGGTLSILNNDPNEASFDISLTGTVTAVTVKDDGEAGFSVVSGTWQGPSNGGFNNDHYFSWFNNGAVEWQFGNLLPGEYRVSATWTHAANRASSAPYLITGGDIGPATALVNQKNAPAADATEGGRSFQHLGKVHVVNGQLVVRLTNTSATSMSADAIRLEYLPPAEIRVFDGASELTDGTSTVDYGSVFFGTPRTLTVQNDGPGTLNLTQLTQTAMPAGFQLVSGFGSTELAQGQLTTFVVAIASQTPGTVSGTIAIQSNDLDERSFDIALTGVVSTVAVKDDGDPGFSIVSGTWQGPSNGGYNNDHYFSHFNNGVVEWRFANLLPGAYRVSATWTNTSSRSAAAPYEVIDDTNGLATVLINQKNAPAADATAGGRNFQDLGQFEIVNGELVVRLTNMSATTMSADAVRLEYVGPATGVSEIRVYDGSAELFDAASTINLGSTFIGTEVPRTLTVKNVGVGTLNLTQLTQGAMPAGVTLVAGYGSTTLAQGETTTFTVALAATSVGNVSGPLSIINNDPDEASFDISLTGVVNSATVKDDGDSGYSVVSGTWQGPSNGGFNNDHYFSYFNNGVVEWRFANVIPGTYRVSATWTNASNRSAAAPYEVIDGTNSLASAPVNQKNAPAADVVVGGRNFQHLGQFEIVNGELVVRLSNTTATTASADAIRLEYLGPAQGASEIRVFNGSTELADGVSTVDFGATFNGTLRTLTVKNVGVGDLTLTQLTQGAMPTGFKLISGFGATTLAQGQSTTLTIALDSATLGAVSGTLSIATNDPDEGSFDIALTGIVQTFRVIDDEDVGFSVVSGTWAKSTGGYNNDQYIVSSGDTGVVEWRHENLAPGQYRVSATWFATAGRTSIAPYTIRDGSTTLATREIDQRFLATPDATIGGRPFQSLGVFGVTNGTLAVQLADASILSVSADAVYLEYLGALPEVQFGGSGGTLLIDGAPATVLDFGDSERTNKATIGVAVTNTTASAITLTQLTQGDMPAGYVLVDHLGSLSLAAGETTTFRVRLDAITPGTYSGTIPIVASVGTFNLSITGEVLLTDVVVDDRSAGFQLTGSSWQSGEPGEGFRDGYLQTAGSGTARWMAEGLAPGTYVIYATYNPSVFNTASAPYKLYDGTTLEQLFTANQQQTSQDACHTPSEPPFEYIGQIEVSSGEVTVELDASGASGGFVVADAIKFVRTTPGTFATVVAPSEMITGSSETLTANFVDPDGQLADTLVVYRDANRNGTLDLGSDTRLLKQPSFPGNALSFDLSTLQSGEHHLIVGAVKNGEVVAEAAVTVTVARLWKVELTPRAKGEARFDTGYDLTVSSVPVPLMPGQTWKDALTWTDPATGIQTVSGTVQTTNTDFPEDYWYTFNSSAFAIGTQYELKKEYGAAFSLGSPACTKMIVLEDLTDSTDPNHPNDFDYDDQYWIVTVTPIVPEIIEPGCGCPTCETEDASAVPGTGDLKVSTGAIASGAGAGLSPSVSLELNQAAAESSGLGAMASTGEWGVGWRRSGIASLVPHGADPSSPNQVSVVFSGVSVRVFTSAPGPGGPTFVRSNGLGTTDTFSLEGGQYAFRTAGGDTYTFNPFDANVPALARGRLVSQTDASGNRLEVSFNPDGSTAAFQSYLPGETTPVEIQDYVYLGAGNPNAGKVERIDIKRGNGTLVRSVTMGYYDDTSPFGEFGQLASITTRDAIGAVLDAKAYRYAEAPSGDSLIQYIFDSEAVRRVAAEGLDIASAANALVAPFATNYLEYDAENRVTRNDEQGKGCSSCAGGIGSFTYAYATNPATGLTDSDWHTKTTETRPDGTERIVYSNGRLQPMLEVIRTNDGGTPRQFGTFTRYDSRGLAIWTASPEAVLLPADLSVIEQYGDLLNEVSGNYQYISDSSGLIKVTTYFTGTTATATTAGSADRYMSSTAVQRGDTGTPILQASYTYFVVSAGGETDTQIASRTEYVTTDGTVSNTTTYAYTYAPGTTRIVSQTTTLPVVSAAQNGSGVADLTEQAFDSFGRTIWTKDADGFLAYMAYDQQTGSVIKTIVDVDTAQTSDFADLPAGWATPSGGGLHLTSTYEVDALGRTTASTDPNGSITYTVYDDVNHSVRTYTGWNSVTGMPTGPTQLSRRDLSGNYTEMLTFSAAPDLAVNGRPTGTEAITNIETLSRSITNAAGQVIASDRYFLVPAYSTATDELGVAGTNFLRTTYAYNNQGQVDRMVNPAGTITLMRYDGRGQQVATYVGTDDSTNDGFKWSPSNASASSNMVLVATNEYDHGGVGNGNLTSTTQYPGGAAEPRTTQYAFDWWNRLVVTKTGATADPGTEISSVNRPLSYVDYDNLGRAITQSIYDGDGVSILDVDADGVPNRPAAGLLRSSQTSAFDSRGRAYRTEVLYVDQSTGAIGTGSLTSDTFFDARGNLAMVMSPNKPVMQYVRDGAGRMATSLTLGNIPDATWANATSLTDSVVLEQVDITYDSAGNAVLTTIRQRFHDASTTDTGLLGTPTSGIPARVSHVASYYDVGNRQVASVNVGTNGGVPYVRPATVPGRSDTELVTDYLYDSAGRVQDVIDPRGIITRTGYDPLGRTVATILNYTGGAPGAQTDVTTTFQFDSSGRLASRTAVQPAGTPSQVTGYVYGTSVIGGSTITSNDLMVETRYPDRITGLPSTTDRNVYTSNASGERTSFSDRAGTTHDYTYNVVGRQTADVITVLGSGVDGSIRRVEQAYDTLGRIQVATTFGAATGGSVTSQVKRAFNGFGQTITEWQSHTGVVDNFTTPRVQYTYSEGAGGNHSRLTSTVYPDGYVVNVTHSGIDDAVSRPTRLTGQRADSAIVATLEAFKYLGMGTVIERSRPEVNINFSSLGTTGDAGDQYAGLDRLGRVIAHNWIDGGSSTIVDGYGYTYDRGDNRLTRSNALNAAFSETYTNDALGQLESYFRGPSGSPIKTQDWQFDALGNWTTITTDGVAEAREANAQNELTDVGGATLTYSATGNLTTDAQGRELVFDAWNRLVAVYDASSTLVARYEYDGMNRRIVEQVGTLATAPTRDLYYSLGWQVLEERVRDSGGATAATATARYVWSPLYVDAMIARDQNADSNSATGTGGLEQRIYALQDANWNTTAIIAATGVSGHTTGDIINRFTYTPYGAVEALDASWSTAASPFVVLWSHLFQGLKFDDTTGLGHARNRDYSASLGRFVERDPIGFKAGDNNWYRFAANQPTHRTDPFGLEASSIGAKIAWELGLIVERGLDYLGTANHGIDKNLIVADELDEMRKNVAIRTQMDLYYQSLGKVVANEVTEEWQPFENSNLNVPGLWRFSSAGAFDTGWWLHGAHRVVAHTAFEARCVKPNVVEVRDLRASWVWHDEIDGRGLGEWWNAGRETWVEFGWSIPNALIESVVWDWFMDGLLDTNFGVRVYWSDQVVEPFSTYTK